MDCGSCSFVFQFSLFFFFVKFKTVEHTGRHIRSKFSVRTIVFCECLCRCWTTRCRRQAPISETKHHGQVSQKQLVRLQLGKVYNYTFLVCLFLLLFFLNLISRADAVTEHRKLERGRAPRSRRTNGGKASFGRRPREMRYMVALP